jgi:predicted DNA-binding protein
MRQDLQGEQKVSVAKPRKALSMRKLFPISIRITLPQKRGLDKLYKRTGLPVREHIRRSLDKYLQEQVE